MKIMLKMNTVTIILVAFYLLTPSVIILPDDDEGSARHTDLKPHLIQSLSVQNIATAAVKRKSLQLTDLKPHLVKFRRNFRG